MIQHLQPRHSADNTCNLDIHYLAAAHPMSCPQFEPGTFQRCSAELFYWRLFRQALRMVPSSTCTCICCLVLFSPSTTSQALHLRQMCRCFFAINHNDHGYGQQQGVKASIFMVHPPTPHWKAFIRTGHTALTFVQQFSHGQRGMATSSQSGLPALRPTPCQSNFPLQLPS